MAPRRSQVLGYFSFTFYVFENLQKMLVTQQPLMLEKSKQPFIYFLFS